MVGKVGKGRSDERGGDWLMARNGKVAVPDGPGLGCDPDMAVVERYRSAPVTVTK